MPIIAPPTDTHVRLYGYVLYIDKYVLTAEHFIQCIELTRPSVLRGLRVLPRESMSDRVYARLGAAPEIQRYRRVSVTPTDRQGCKFC